MKYRPTIGSVIFDSANILFILLLMASMLFPFLYILSVSVSDYWEITYNKVKLLPKGPLHLNSYRILLNATDMGMAYINSVIYAVGAVIATLIVTSMAAYVLEHKRLALRKPLIVYAVLTIFLPSSMIPTFLTVRGLGLYDTRWAVILLPSFSAWYIMVMRANIRATIAQELKDAAYIDGANHLQTFFRVALPLLKPILATIGLFSAVGSWNNYLYPLLYLGDPQKAPLTLLLRRILLEDYVGKFTGNFQDQMLREGLDTPPGFFKSFRFASIVITVWPIIMVYPFIQRYFVKGILVGSLKS